MKGNILISNNYSLFGDWISRDAPAPPLDGFDVADGAVEGGPNLVALTNAAAEVGPEVAADDGEDFFGFDAFEQAH